MIEYITIGKIPENCKSLIIYCGDFSSSDTIEFNFSITPNIGRWGKTNSGSEHHIVE